MQQWLRTVAHPTNSRLPERDPERVPVAEADRQALRLARKLLLSYEFNLKTNAPISILGGDLLIIQIPLISALFMYTQLLAPKRLYQHNRAFS